MQKPFVAIYTGFRNQHPREWHVEGLPFEKVYASTQDQADYIADAMNKAYEAGRQVAVRETVA